MTTKPENNSPQANIAGSRLALTATAPAPLPPSAHRSKGLVRRYDWPSKQRIHIEFAETAFTPSIRATTTHH
jgi:hypothetical protein